MEVPSIFLNRILSETAQKAGSDLHLAAGSPPMARINGQFSPLSGCDMVSSEMINKVAESFLSQDDILKLKESKSAVFVKNFSNFRFRANVFYQKGLLSISFHYIPAVIKNFSDLGIGEAREDFLKQTAGLLIIAGTYNSGKTTTAASLIEELNKTKTLNIATVEDPIEYLFVSKKSLITQRQIGSDANTVSDALDDCLSEDVDVVYINEIKDENALNAAMPKIFDLAAGNCLVILEINADSVERVLEKILAGISEHMIPESARYNLADILIGVLVQKLVNRRGGGFVLANEILINNSAAKSLIREGKIRQLENVMQISRKQGMITMEKSVENLFNTGAASRPEKNNI